MTVQALQKNEKKSFVFHKDFSRGASGLPYRKKDFSRGISGLPYRNAISEKNNNMTKESRPEQQ